MRRPRRRLWRTTTLAVLLLIALTSWLGVRALAAQQHLEAARGSLAQAREALLDRRTGEARAAIAAAGRETERARSLTGDPLWRATAAVPYAGASFAAVRSVAAAADDVARRVLPEALSASVALEPNVLRRVDGSFDLDRISAATPAVRRSASTLEQVRDRLTRQRPGAVVPAIGAARQDLTDQVASLASALQSADRALTLAPALLGSDRPRRFFVLVQQTSESRGTGGLTGGFAVLETDKGRITVTGQGSNAELLNGPVPVPAGLSPEYVELYGGNGAFELWQNVNLSPDLPAVARVVEARWRAQGGAALDGVVALDGTALATVLRGSPPLDIGGRTVAVDQLAEFLAVEQYRGVPPGADQAGRKDQLADVAALVSNRLAGGQGDSDALLRGLVEAVRSGHLRMASADPALGPGLRAAGVDGSLPQDESPFVYPVVFNASAGKLDHFLDRRVRYIAGPCEQGRRRTSVAVALTNRAPEAGLPPYLTIRVADGMTTQSTEAAVVLQVYATRRATLVGATLDGQPITTVPAGDAPFLTVAREQGLPLWFVQLDLAREVPRELVLVLDEPAVDGPLRVLEQPLSRALASSVEAPGCG